MFLRRHTFSVFWSFHVIILETFWYFFVLTCHIPLLLFFLSLVQYFFFSQHSILYLKFYLCEFLVYPPGYKVISNIHIILGIHFWLQKSIMYMNVWRRNKNENLNIYSLCSIFSYFRNWMNTGQEACFCISLA